MRIWKELELRRFPYWGTRMTESSSSLEGKPNQKTDGQPQLLHFTRISRIGFCKAIPGLLLPTLLLRTLASTSSASSYSAAHLLHCSVPTRLSFYSSQRRTTCPKLRYFRQFTVICGTSITEINETEFNDTVLKTNHSVLIEFVTNWCGPCRLISPTMEPLAQEYEDRLTVVKVDHDANPRLIEEYKVYELPTLIHFKNGQEVPESRREGAITKVKLKDYVDALLESISILLRRVEILFPSRFAGFLHS
ncbi:thioredoxin X, chloroplastic-like [Arachis duranensis]|uniref:Thioredoxin X, chloroplastic-like n=1 Tax=Arachis duranensis TaxID=130453 RepID=A0A6P5MW25_ARADU|nr:thioredoxin X, chloroplastic-like [Arachis duranensis]